MAPQLLSRFFNSCKGLLQPGSFLLVWAVPFWTVLACCTRPQTLWHRVSRLRISSLSQTEECHRPASRTASGSSPPVPAVVLDWVLLWPREAFRVLVHPGQMCSCSKEERHMAKCLQPPGAPSGRASSIPAQTWRPFGCLASLRDHDPYHSASLWSFPDPIRSWVTLPCLVNLLTA